MSKLGDLTAVASIVGMISFGTMLSTKTTTSNSVESMLRDKVATLEKSLLVSQESDKSARSLLSLVFAEDMSSYSLASTTVTITAYSATAAETDDTPHLTADMTLSRIGLIAVSRDLLNILSYGQVVLLPDYGLFRVSDTMNPRFTSRVDILHSSPRSARLFGIHHNQKLIWTF